MNRKSDNSQIPSDTESTNNSETEVLENINLLSVNVFNKERKFIEFPYMHLIGIFNKYSGNILSPKALTLSDLCKGKDTKSQGEIKTLISTGTPFFDAVIINRLSDEEFKQVKQNAIRKIDEDQIQMALGVLFISLMLRGNVPDDVLPKFIINFFGLSITGSWESLKGNLSSFNLNTLNHGWIRKIDLSKIPKELKDRFDKGIAGYRLINFIVSTSPNKSDENLDRVYKRVLRIKEKGPSWDCHPLTRATCPMWSLKSMNSLLWNYINAAYSKKQLDLAVEEKKLYKIVDSDSFDVADYQAFFQFKLEEVDSIYDQKADGQ